MRAVSLAFGLAVSVSGAAAQQGDPVVHMSKEPRHRVVFESGTTRVQDVQIPPGDITLFHTHDHAVLYVPIGSSRTRAQVLGEEWSGGGRSGATTTPAPAQPGRLSAIISYVDKPVTHRVNNVGESLFRLIAVGNLGRGADADDDDDDRSGLGGKPEILNKYYRAFRVALAAGQATPAHKHAWPVVVVQQTAGQLAVDGSSRASTSEPGRFVVHDGTGEHRVTNSGSAAVEIIEIELRGAALK